MIALRTDYIKHQLLGNYLMVRRSQKHKTTDHHTVLQGNSKGDLEDSGTKGGASPGSYAGPLASPSTFGLGGGPLISLSVSVSGPWGLGQFVDLYSSCNH